MMGVVGKGLRPVKHPICTTKKDGIAIYTCNPPHVLVYDYDKMVDKGTIFTALLAKPAIFRVRRKMPAQFLFLALVAGAANIMMDHLVKKELKIVEDALLGQALNNVSNATSNASNATLTGTTVRRLHYTRRLQDDSGDMGGGEVDDGQVDDQLLADEAATTSVGSSEVLKAKAVKTVYSYWKEQVKPLADLGMYVNAFVGFVLGLFLALSITRWWQLRAVHLHTVSKSMKNLNYSLSCILPEDLFYKVRRRMARRCLLSHALLYACARGEIRQKRLNALLEEKLLTRDELKILCRGIQEMDKETQEAEDIHHDNKDFSMAMLPMLWNCNEVHRLFRAGHFAPPIVAMLHGLCMDARNGMEGVHLMVSCPLPFTYTHLICLLVHSAVLLAACKCGLQQALSKTTLQVICEALFCLCLCAVYLGLLHMVAVIERPFGDGLMDVSWVFERQQLHRKCKLGGEKNWSDLGDVALRNVRLPQVKPKVPPSVADTPTATPIAGGGSVPSGSSPSTDQASGSLGVGPNDTAPGPSTKPSSIPELLS